MARRKLMNSRVQLWNHVIAVDWAEPELEVDEEIMAMVRGKRNHHVVFVCIIPSVRKGRVSID